MMRPGLIPYIPPGGGGGGGDVDWGDIGGALADQTDLDAALGGKAPTSHTHAASAITSGTIDPARIPGRGKFIVNIPVPELSPGGAWEAPAFIAPSAGTVDVQVMSKPSSWYPEVDESWAVELRVQYSTNSLGNISSSIGVDNFFGWWAPFGNSVANGDSVSVMLTDNGSQPSAVPAGVAFVLIFTPA